MRRQQYTLISYARNLQFACTYLPLLCWR